MKSISFFTEKHSKSVRQLGVLFLVPYVLHRKTKVGFRRKNTWLLNISVTILDKDSDQDKTQALSRWKKDVHVF